MKTLTKQSFLTLSILITLSGIGYLLTDEFLSTETLFGHENHFSQSWWQAAHVFIGAFFLVALGMLVSEHLRPKLLSKNLKRRRSGLTLLSLISVSSISGYLIMFVSSSNIEEVIELIHWVSGLFFAGALIYHLKFSK
tara:strand:- start:8818 stop:9231 length:414 start_codon:yes stop_codon:yes gene_type:complete